MENERKLIVCLPLCISNFWGKLLSLSRTLLAMIDWLSYRWLMTQLQSPSMEFKLVIMLIHENNRQ